MQLPSSVRTFGFAILLVLWATWMGSEVHRSRYVPNSLDLLTLTAQDAAQLLQNGTITSVQLTKEYLSRIKRDDRAGLGLHTVLELTPEPLALAMAEDLDRERRDGLIRSPLHGVPLLAKGNMATDVSLGMHTSLGAYALRNAIAHEDAFIVKKAREAGLIILGKTNLAELNGFKDGSISPGYSSLGGETLSPYDLKHPCGSSAGSASAVAAGFAPLSLGSETQGSISCPASFTALYGLKASTGLLSRHGILPSSTTFDSRGVFAKSAWDVVALLTAIQGVDGADPITADSESHLVNMTNSLDSQWKDFRIGVADREWFWSIIPDFIGDQAGIDDEEKMFQLGLGRVKEMERRGATIVADAKIRSASLSINVVPKLMGTIIRHEMKPGFTKYVKDLSGGEVDSFESLVEFNNRNADLSYQDGDPGQSYLEEALAQHLDESEYREALRMARRIAVDEGIIETLDRYELDALVLPGWTQMSIYAAWAQAPTATVPLGRYRDGKPYGMGFVARRFDDLKLLQIMHLYEKTFPPRLVSQRMKRRNWEDYLTHAKSFFDRWHEAPVRM